jgi:polar amino acid transport system substrate-binding protein
MRHDRLMQIRMWGAAAAVIIVAAAMAPAKADKLQDILNRGHLIIGTSSTNPPFGFKNEKGELQGFDIDVSRLMAEALFDDPNKVKFELISLEARWSALQTDKVDAIVMITTILPNRLKRVAFTPPYVDSGMAMLVRKDTGIKHLADIDKDSVTVATLTVPEQIDIVKRFIPKAKVASFETVDQQFLALKSKRVAGMEVDLPLGMWYAAQDTDMYLVPELFSGYQNYAIAYKLGELGWKQFLDGFVTELTTGSDYFEYEKIFKKYFNRSPPPQRFYKIDAAQ